MTHFISFHIPIHIFSQSKICEKMWIVMKNRHIRFLWSHFTNAFHTPFHNAPCTQKMEKLHFTTFSWKSHFISFHIISYLFTRPFTRTFISFHNLGCQNPCWTACQPIPWLGGDKHIQQLRSTFVGRSSLAFGLRCIPRHSFLNTELPGCAEDATVPVPWVDASCSPWIQHSGQYGVWTEYQYATFQQNEAKGYAVRKFYRNHKHSLQVQPARSHGVWWGECMWNLHLGSTTVGLRRLSWSAFGKVRSALLIITDNVFLAAYNL